jgi:hypothetical protein
MVTYSRPFLYGNLLPPSAPRCSRKLGRLCRKLALCVDPRRCRCLFLRSLTPWRPWANRRPRLSSTGVWGDGASAMDTDVVLLASESDLSASTAKLILRSPGLPTPPDEDWGSSVQGETQYLVTIGSCRSFGRARF